MATEKGNAETSFNTKDDSVQPSSSIKHLEDCHFGKALAYRAVFGISSGYQRSGSRKTIGNDAAKTSPSRLSNVTVAGANDTDN